MCATPREIIYVDASLDAKKKRYKISFVGLGKEKNTYIGEEVQDTNMAERYAILYALYYIQKNGSKKKRYCILSDSANSVKRIAYTALIQKGYTISIHWIPREINLADSVSKQKAKKKPKLLNKLRIMQKESMSEIDSKKQNQKQEKKEMVRVQLTKIEKKVFTELLSYIQVHNNDVITPREFADLVIFILRKEKIAKIKGVALSMRKRFILLKILTLAPKNRLTINTSIKVS